MTEPIKELETKSPDILALEAQLKEAEMANARKQVSELEAAKTKITELEQTINEQTRRLAEIEHGSRVKELQAEIEKLHKEPVYHTKITTNEHGATARELELDNDEFPAFTAKDFGE